jgi:hypothetical protein
MTAHPNTKEFHELAARVICFEPPEQALRDVSRFMAFAFRQLTHDVMQKLRAKLNDDDLRNALANTPPGIIDPRSWSYWQVIVGIFSTPRLTKRNFLGEGETQFNWDTTIESTGTAFMLHAPQPSSRRRPGSI